MAMKPRLKGYMAMKNEAKSFVTEADKGTSFLYEKKYLYSNKNKKTTFLQTIRNKIEVPLSASMTVEASICLPLFIFFMVNILAAFNIIKVQSDLEAALHQTGSEISIMAFDERFAGNLLLGDEDMNYDEGAEGLISSGGYFVYAIEGIKSYLGDSINKSCVKDGSSGLSFYSSRVLLGNDIVDIVVDYKVKPIIPLIGFKEFPVQSRYYGHAWTGYDISLGVENQSQEEEVVYVTENGEVYHKSASCRYLKIDVKSVSLNSVVDARNSDGSKYYPCEYCGQNVAAGNVFITDYGERYHTSVNCPGLKRKIYTIPLSEAGAYRPCSSCAH